MKKGLGYAFGELLTDIAKPFFTGVLAAGLIMYFFPDDITAWAGDKSFTTMLIMLAAGIPMYVCATSSTPVAAALIMKGLNPGAALVFLLAGPATNAATMNMVKNIFNTRALGIYLSMIALSSLAMGFLADWLYSFLDISASVTAGQAAHIIPYQVKLASAAVLVGLTLFNLAGGSKTLPKHTGHGRAPGNVSRP